MTRTHIYLTIAFCLVFAGGIFLGHSVWTNATQIANSQASQDFSEDGTKYKFIDPLLFCQDQGQNLSNRGANEIENEVGNYVTQEKNNNDIIDAAFYFRDLNGGSWALVNPDYQSMPASLLKVPVAISVYQRAEEDPGFLKSTFTLSKSIQDMNADQSEHFQAPERVQPNTNYTVEGLVRLMLEDSDNIALYMLGNMFTLQELQSAFTHLGIDAPGNGTSGYTMSVKTYASFFLVLYNATFLTQNDSEHVLSLLSQSTFTQGIVAGLPQGTVVAHKFGESASPGDPTLQLNDCGIVYKPNQPYLICIMTKGTDYDSLAMVISSISKMTYDTVNSSD